VVNLLVSPRSARSPPRKLPIPPPCSRSPVDLSPGWELGITSFYNPYANHGAGITNICHKITQLWCDLHSWWAFQIYGRVYRRVPSKKMTKRMV
jgi:hypothetical protein